MVSKFSLRKSLQYSKAVRSQDEICKPFLAGPNIAHEDLAFAQVLQLDANQNGINDGKPVGINL